MILIKDENVLINGHDGEIVLDFGKLLKAFSRSSIKALNKDVVVGLTGAIMYQDESILERSVQDMDKEVQQKYLMIYKEINRAYLEEVVSNHE